MPTLRDTVSKTKTKPPNNKEPSLAGSTHPSHRPSLVCVCVWGGEDLGVGFCGFPVPTTLSEFLQEYGCHFVLEIKCVGEGGGVSRVGWREVPNLQKVTVPGTSQIP